MKTAATTLDLTHRNLRSVPNFPPNQPISQLILDSNRFSSLQSLPTDLQTLSANCNRLISLSGLQLCTGLVELHLHKNYISDDQVRSLLLLRELKVVELSGNRLSDGVGIGQLMRLPRLEELDVSGNRVAGLEVEYPAVALKKLVVDCNRLEKLCISAECPALLRLSCSDNHLSSLEGLSNAPRLQYLHLDMNDFSDFPANLDRLKPLRQLSISHNSLSYPVSLHLPVLQILHCAYNRLHSLSFLSHSRLLQELHCDHNQLQELAFGPLPELQTLRIA